MDHRLRPALRAACAALLATTAFAQTPERVVAERHDDGVIRVSGPRWQAEFGPAGAVLEAEAGADGTGIASLQLRYLGHRRGDQHRAADASPAPVLDERHVRVAHGRVSERYELCDEGIEQTFRFASRPAGSGDLVLEIAIGGTVQAAATAGAAHQPLEFRHPTGGSIRYGEAFAFDRAGAKVEVATRYDGAGHLELVVPAAFVDAANYPLLVDPTIGPVLLPSTSIGNDSEPDVAHDVEQDRYMVVWRRTFAASTQIWVALHRGDGSLVSSGMIATGTGLQAPAVAFTRCLIHPAFLVVWEQASGAIQGYFLESSGGVGLNPAPFQISSPGGGERDRRPSVSGSDGAIFVAWDRTGIGATQPQRVMVRDLYWLNPANPNGITYGSEHTLQAVPTGYVLNVRMARSSVAQQIGGATWYANRAVWQRFFVSPPPGDADIHTLAFRAKVGPFGYAEDQSLASVPGAADIAVNEIAGDIGSCASVYHDPTDLRYLVVWEDSQDVLAQMFDQLGPVGGNITVRATSAFEGAPTVGAGYCEFTVGYLQAIPPNEFDLDVYAARVLRDGTVTSNHTLVDNPGGQYQDHVRASSRPILDTTQFLHNTTLLTWMGQTGAGTDLNDVRARFFAPVIGFDGFFGAACAGPGGTLPTIDSIGGAPNPGNDLYAITLNNAPPNSLAVLLVGTTLVDVPIPGAPGCSLYTDLPFIALLPAISDAAGYAAIPLPMPCSLPLSPVATQWAVLTPGWNAFGWITSNDLDLGWQD